MEIRRRLQLIVACGFIVVGIVFGVVSQIALAQDNTVDYTLTDLTGRDFSYKDLSGTSFAAAEMRKANFTGADLSQTILTKASFLQSNLANVDLSNSFADRVVFDRCDLSNAIIVDAMMPSSTFRDAIIEGADFSGSIIDRYQVTSLCKYASGVNSKTGISTRDSLGCR